MNGTVRDAGGWAAEALRCIGRNAYVLSNRTAYRVTPDSITMVAITNAGDVNDIGRRQAEKYAAPSLAALQWKQVVGVPVDQRQKHGFTTRQEARLNMHHAKEKSVEDFVERFIPTDYLKNVLADINTRGGATYKNYERLALLLLLRGHLLHREARELGQRRRRCVSNGFRG